MCVLMHVLGHICVCVCVCVYREKTPQGVMRVLFACFQEFVYYT